MKRAGWRLLGVLVVAGGVAFGVNTALGDPPTPETIPQQPKPDSTPEPFPADATPIVDTHSDSPGGFLPPASEPDKRPTIFIRGEEVPLPDGASYSTVSADLGPGTLTDEPRHFTVIRVGKSFLKFADGILLESHVEPKDTAALEPLLEKLTPRDHFDIPYGERGRISLPAGVSFTTVYPGSRVGKEYPSDYPSFFMVVEAGDSWVHFDQEGVIIGSQIEPQDAEALQPVIDQLRPR